jgi:hypothetical protein
MCDSSVNIEWPVASRPASSRPIMSIIASVAMLNTSR